MKKKAPSRKTRTDRIAPTLGGRTVRQTQLTNVPLFPVRKYVKGQLYYESGMILSSTIGSLASYAFSANGVYDPNATGTGHQPIGFDQMMSMYEQYCVIRSHIKVTFLAADEPTKIAIMLAPDTTVPTVTAAMENGLLVTSMVAGATGDGGANRIKTLELACDVPKYFGKSYQAILADPLQSGSIATNPSEQVYYQILAWEPFGAGSSSVAIDVTISYDVMYWEPKKLASS